MLEIGSFIILRDDRVSFEGQLTADLCELKGFQRRRITSPSPAGEEETVYPKIPSHKNHLEREEADLVVTHTGRFRDPVHEEGAHGVVLSPMRRCS